VRIDEVLSADGDGRGHHGEGDRSGTLHPHAGPRQKIFDGLLTRVGDQRRAEELAGIAGGESLGGPGPSATRVQHERRADAEAGQHVDEHVDAEEIEAPAPHITQASRRRTVRRDLCRRPRRGREAKDKAGDPSTSRRNPPQGARRLGGAAGRQQREDQQAPAARGGVKADRGDRQLARLLVAPGGKGRARRHAQFPGPRRHAHERAEVGAAARTRGRAAPWGAAGRAARGLAHHPSSM
jgi:hypothetical protein